MQALKQNLHSLSSDFSASSGDAKNLGTVNSLAEAFQRYGISTSDVISRRELISTYNKVVEEKEKLYEKHMQNCDYMAAKKVRKMLDALKEECDDRQRMERRRAQISQKKTMDAAK